MGHASIDNDLKLDDFSRVDDTAIYLAFSDAFQKYKPAVKLTLAGFRNKFFDFYHTDGNLSLQLNIGNHVAGFCMVSRGRMHNYPAGWISAMGIRSNYRGRGWSHFLLKKVIENAEKGNLERLVLEVHTWNDQAVNLFSSYDFKVSRKLAACKRIANKTRMDPRHEIRTLPGVNVPFELSETVDYETSFQESLDFIRKEIKSHVTLVIYASGIMPAGYLIMDSATGRLRHVYVLPDARRQGLGTSLVNYAAMLQNTLTIINVNADDSVACGFLRKLGFRQEMEQYEMIRNL